MNDSGLKTPMKNFLLITVLALSASLVACQKQQSDEEKKAEVERQVQERLAAEHQQQQTQELAQREASVAAREQAVKEKQDAEAAAPAQTAAEPQGCARNDGPETVPIRPFTPGSSLMAIGSKRMTTVMFINRARPRTAAGVLTQMAAGFTPTPAGHGFPTSHSAGQLITTGAGHAFAPWLGLGSWRSNGRRPGFHGAKADNMSAGRPLPPEAHFDRASGIRNWSDSYYDVGPDQYCFRAPRPSLASNASNASSSPSNRTSPL